MFQRMDVKIKIQLYNIFSVVMRKYIAFNVDNIIIYGKMLFLNCLYYIV